MKTDDFVLGIDVVDEYNQKKEKACKMSSQISDMNVCGLSINLSMLRINKIPLHIFSH